jgi:hypothetical protein
VDLIDRAVDGRAVDGCGEGAGGDGSVADSGRIMALDGRAVPEALPEEEAREALAL